MSVDPDNMISYTRVVPLGVKSTLEGWGITNCVELDWWDKYSLSTGEINALTPSSVSSLASSNNNWNEGSAGDSLDDNSVEITFTPTRHWGARHPFDRFTSLWGSFVVNGKNGRVFFGGDTAYCSVFKTIGEVFGPFDISLLPIGAYLPRELMMNSHCDPAEAVLIHKDLRSDQSVAIHWGTFHLSDDEDVEPAFELNRVRTIAGVSKNQFCTLALGETLVAGAYPQFDLATVWPKEALSYVDKRFEQVAKRRQLETARQLRKEKRKENRKLFRKKLKMRKLRKGSEELESKSETTKSEVAR
jgi:L-ascorbate metabolism protein UlaG (beta-lactamase superfamily)